MQEKAIAAVRALSVAGVEKAKSGHPGLPLGVAPMAVELWSNHMKHNPANPDWFNRDRFILSAGHGSMLIYSLLHLFGYGLKKEDLEDFRQWDSKTPGHPEYGHTVGVEATTGPLGQGITMAVGMAMAENHLAARFNTEEHKLIDHHTYVIASDGDLMEGVSAEAASLAGTLKLGKLIVLYDDNSITIEGSTDLAFTEDVGKRFEAYGWHVLEVTDGNDCSAVSRALDEAKAREDRPSLIKVKTIIGYGSPKADTAAVHGAPLGSEGASETYEFLNWNSSDPFTVDEDLTEWFKEKKSLLGQSEEEWLEVFKAWQLANPEQAKELKMRVERNYPEIDVDELSDAVSKDIATRSASGLILNALYEKGIPFFGGSADLAPSNMTMIDNQGSYSSATPECANIHFGVREFAMAAICNGMALHGGVLAYSATFLVFSDYMRGAIRLSALMQVPQVFVFTHDSIGLGEDGPTHQPVEHLTMLRSTPGLTVLRPAGRLETAAAWKHAVESNKPSALILTRQTVPSAETNAKRALRGAYVARDAKDYEAIIMASGSELELALAAADLLETEGHPVRVVSMMSFELFEEQDVAYKERVLPAAMRKRLAVEAAADMPWYRYVGLDGDVVGLNHFGASAPANVLFEKFGFTAENVAQRCLDLIEKD
ncbi:MAG: transketolase [Clostridiaceae bacterium]|nr:transketolase [Clostridiaceae bacterium]